MKRKKSIFELILLDQMHRYRVTLVKLHILLIETSAIVLEWWSFIIQRQIGVANLIANHSFFTTFESQVFKLWSHVLDTKSLAKFLFIRERVDKNSISIDCLVYISLNYEESWERKVLERIKPLGRTRTLEDSE